MGSAGDLGSIGIDPLYDPDGPHPPGFGTLGGPYYGEDPEPISIEIPQKAALQLRYWTIQTDAVALDITSYPPPTGNDALAYICLGRAIAAPGGGVQFIQHTSGDVTLPTTALIGFPPPP